MTLPLPRRRLLQMLVSGGPTSAILMASRTRASPPKEATSVSILMPAPIADATAPVVQRFNRLHRDIHIAVTRGPLDTESLSDLAISSLLLGDSPFDLLMMDVSWTARYAAAGWLTPLETLLGEGAMDGLLPAARRGNAFGGHLWRMPLSGDAALLYWRTDLLQRPPRDTRELVAMGRDLQRDGKVPWGYVWQGKQYEGLSCVALEVLEAFGAHWWDGQRERTDLLTPAALAATTWLTDLVRTGISPPGVANFAENDALQLFSAGEAAFLRNWPYAWRLIQEEKGPVAGKIGVVPVVGAPGFQGRGTLGTWGLSLLKGSPHPEASARVVQWLTGPDAQRQLVLLQGYAPTWKSLYADPLLKAAHPLLQVQQEALESAVARPLTPLYAQLSNVLQRQLNALLTSDLEPERALARAQQQSQLITQSAGATASP